MSKLGDELKDAAALIERHHAKLVEMAKVTIPEEG